MAESNKKSHGGPGRGQGRKPVNDGEPMVVVPMRMTPSQREKLGRLGGAGWVRDRIDVTVGGNARCRRCGGAMKASKAIAQTYTGAPDFPGQEVVTLSPGGPGRLVDCLKCGECGHSVTANDIAERRP